MSSQGWWTEILQSDAWNSMTITALLLFAMGTRDLISAYRRKAKGMEPFLNILMVDTEIMGWILVFFGCLFGLTGMEWINWIEASGITLVVVSALRIFGVVTDRFYLFSLSALAIALAIFSFMDDNLLSFIERLANPNQF